ncbi:MAG TPA: molybdate ABC transporter substrate-binding protein, partial [Anaerolineae bacterium]|nr:molybdate ABC transporter substrate-binding protein [Anaerolineae bacterium]
TAAPAPTAVPQPTTAPAQPTTATTGNNAGGTLTVYAAASLTDAFKEIGQQFQAANPGTTVEFNFAGSQDLVTQITNGAKADIFASADLKNMDALNSKSLVSGTPQVFARNHLVVIVPKDNQAGIKTLQDLAKVGVKLDLADKTVPVGNYTLQMLDKLSADATYGAGFKDSVLKNVVSQENNVKAVVSKVSLGEADAGVVYSTDAQTAADKVTTIDVPDQFNVIAMYPIVTVKGTLNSALAEKWIAFVLSPQGQAVLDKYGFIPPS